MGVMEKFRLDGKVAWITGASYGLGLAYAEALAEAGAKIVFNDINQDLVDRGLAEYAKRGLPVYGAVCDVTNEEAVNKFVADVKEKVGVIDILINNAGIIKRIPMTEMTLAQWNQVINVDLTGPFLCSKAVIPGMIEKGAGKIINACSMMSEVGRETVSAYAAAKGGLKMLTKNICSEYGQYNPGLHCDSADRSAPRKTGRRVHASVRPLHPLQDAGSEMGQDRGPYGSRRLPFRSGFRLHQRPGRLHRRRHPCIPRPGSVQSG